MAVSRVQVKTNSGQAVTSLATTFTSATTTGNTILVVISDYNDAHTPSTVTDNKGNTYNHDLNYQGSGTGPGSVHVYSASNITGGASHAVTVSTGGGAWYFVVTIIELSGVQTTTPLDQQSVAQTPVTGSNYSSPSVTTTSANEYLLGISHMRNVSTTPTQSGTWTSVGTSSDGSFHQQFLQEKVVSSTGSYVADGTFTGTGIDTTSIVTYIAASGGASPQSLSGTASSATWTVSSGTFATSSSNQSLVGGAASNTWTVPAGTLGSGASGPLATPSRVQFKSGFAQAGASVALTFGSSTTSGNTILVAASCYYNNTVPSSVTDNKGNTYTRDVNYNPATGSIVCYRASNITGGSGHIVTVTYGAATYFLATAIEVSGLTNTSPLDQTSGAVNPTTGQSYTSPAVTTTVTNEYLLGINHCQNDSTSLTAASPWANVDTISDGTPPGNGFQRQHTQDLVVTSTGTYASSGTFSGSSVQGAVIATYKAGTAGPSNQTITGSAATSTWTVPVGTLMGGTIILQGSAPTWTFNAGSGSFVGGGVLTNLGSFQLGAGWTTMGYSAQQGAILASEYPVLGALNTQTDIKNTWPDGSLRFAVVSAFVSAPGTYAVSKGANATGSPFTPTWPTASVAFNIGGTTYTATLPTFNSSDPWLDGPLVREHRVVVVPQTAGAVQHPLLQVVFDIRAYSDGTSRVDITTQNTRNSASMDQITYDLTITVNGSAVFTKSAYTHYSLTKWRKTFATGGLTESAIVPDFEPYIQAHALQRYLSGTSNQTYNTDPTTNSNYDIGKWGSMNPINSAPGGHAEIGPMPNWAGQYMANKGTTQRSAILRNADLAGSWSHFLMDTDGVSLIKMSTRPNFYFNAGADSSYDRPLLPTAANPGEGNTSYRGAVNIAFAGYHLDQEHIPGVIYPAYILTGDRYYVDTMKAWANNMVLMMWPSSGHSEDGIVTDRTHPTAGYGTLGYIFLRGDGSRGFAWTFREVVSAAVVCPDADADKSYLTALVSHNLAWLAYYQNLSDKTGVFNLPSWEGGNASGFVRVSTWQLDYAAWSIDWAGWQGFDLGNPASNTPAAVRNRILNGHCAMFTNGANGFDPTFGCPGYPRTGYRDASNVPHLYTTIADFWNANQTSGYGWQPAFYPNGTPAMVGYYGPEAFLTASIANREGLSNGAGAYNYLSTYRDPSGFTVVEDAKSNRAGFAIDFTTTSSGTPSSQSLSFPPNTPNNTWVVPSGTFFTGQTVLTGAAASASFTVPSGTFTANVVLSGSASTASWTVPAGTFAVSAVALVGSAPFIVWNVPPPSIATGQGGSSNSALTGLSGMTGIGCLTIFRGR